MEGTSAVGLARRFGLLFAFLLIVLVLSFLSPRFMTLSNLINLLRQSTINGIIAVGMTIVILTAGIDLSVGSTLGFTAVVTADLLHLGLPVPLTIIAGLLLGCAIGCINGFLVARVGIPPFIATLGMMTLARGLAFAYTEGKPITGLDEGFRQLGAGVVGGVPTPIIVAIAVYAIAFLLMGRTRHGEYIYSIGNNPIAAELAGVAVKRYTVFVYSISGFCAALAGMILIGRLDSAQPTIGQGYEFNAIAAVVVGGTSFSGGEGSLWGTIVGVLIISVINNGLNLLNVSSFYEQIVKGVIIAVALLVHRLVKR